MLVGFGQVMCGAVRPKCSECSVSDSCPYGKSYLLHGTPSKSPKPKAQKLKQEAKVPKQLSTPHNSETKKNLGKVFSKDSASTEVTIKEESTEPQCERSSKLSAMDKFKYSSRN